MSTVAEYIQTNKNTKFIKLIKCYKLQLKDSLQMNVEVDKAIGTDVEKIKKKIVLWYTTNRR
jgi:hypothetical protein